jgi:hypothetical protein
MLSFELAQLLTANTIIIASFIALLILLAFPLCVYSIHVSINFRQQTLTTSDEI